MKRYTLLIGGTAVETANHADIRNPSTGDIVGAMPLATRADLDAAVEAATQAFATWKLKSSTELADACRAVAGKIETDAEELAQLLTLEQGKPLNGLGSRFEIGGALAWTRHTAEIELPVEVLQDAPEGRVELHRKPIGVVGSITPWNWPVMIACWHIIPAIRAGNTVIIKPSPLTPLSTIRLVELMNEVLPPGVVNVVTGENEIGSALSAHPGIAKVTFTGSTATGKKVMASAVDTLKRLTLELGGNDAGIVLPDADPNAIAEGLFWGAFINNGQTCACLKRLYVHDSIYDAVCETSGRLCQQHPGRRRHGGKFGARPGAKQDAVRDRRLLCRGGESQRWAHPDRWQSQRRSRLFLSGDAGGRHRSWCRLVDLEQFGPALPIIRYTDVEEAIRKANDNPAGLGGSVWGTDLNKAKEVAGRLECGSVWINKHGAIQPNAPFGGVKQSGIGVEFGADGLKEFTTIQTVFC